MIPLQSKSMAASVRVSCFVEFRASLDLRSVENDQAMSPERACYVIYILRYAICRP